MLTAARQEYAAAPDSPSLSITGDLTIDAFVSIVPAYLVAVIRGKSNYELSALVLSQLTRKQHDNPKRLDARQNRMTGPQRRVIARAFDILARTDRFIECYKTEIEAALETWRPFLDCP